MLCQHCKKNPATVACVEIINGNKFGSKLCAQCYADLCGELNSKANKENWADLLRGSSKQVKVCPVCGTTYADYERTGLLGCTSCYDVFKEELTPSIQRIQGRTTHVGKVANNNDEFGLHRKLNVLQEQLEEAMRRKKYAEAGRLNRQIDEIRKALNGGGANG